MSRRRRCAGSGIHTIIDPLFAFTGGKVDIHRANECRAISAPLTAIAERTGCALVAVRQLALLLSAPSSQSAGLAESAPEWMTDVELARYWRLLKDGEPVTAGIRAWAKRTPDEHPLPHAYMGDLLRFKREEVDRWAVEEAGRRRVKAGRKKLRVAG